MPIVSSRQQRVRVQGAGRCTVGWLRRSLVPLFCIALAAGAAAAHADALVRHFDIQPALADSALQEFARQADISLLFSSSLVASHQTPGVRGDFTVADALQRLLEGTGLSFKQVSATTFAISAASSAIEVRDPPAGAPGTGRIQSGKSTGIEGSSNMNHRGLFTRLASLLALGAGVADNHAYAQDTSTATTTQAAPADASSANTSTLDEVVVTGTAASAGVKKLDASFSISTASLEEIRDASPSSAADLLKIVPGLWAESSAGAAGANIELAGFPGGGDAPYVTYSINGSPVFPSSGNVSFMDNSSLFRIDESIERAEVLQGGPGVVFSNGQMGATANFILRRGTGTAHGDVGLTLGSEGMYRLDGFYGGPVAQDWFVSIAGFYRYSNGIRATQYPADDGGQLTGTLTHVMDNGSVMFFARVLNDKNVFVTDVPVTVRGTGTSQSVAGFPGFNPNTGTFAGDGLRGISVQEAPGAQPVTADLADGRGANLHTFGADFDLQVNDQVAFSNKLMYTGGDVNCYCLFNNSSPQTLSSFISDQITAVNGNTDITSVAGPAGAGTGKLVTTGGAVEPGSYVASLGFWIVQKHIQSFTDDLRFTFELVPGNTLTVGGYLAAYSSRDRWWLGNNELVTATPNAQLIDLTLDNGVNVTSNAGLLEGAFFALNASWNGLNTALFASDQWKIGPWLLDAGYRIEAQKDHGTVENDSSLDLDNNVLNRYNKGVSVPNGTFSTDIDCDHSGSNECTRYSHALGSWSVGANYELTHRMSLFGRVNHGVHFPGFDDLRSGTPQTQSIYNYEVGYRAQTDTIYGVIDAFHRTFTGVPFQQFTAAGNNITATYGASSWGVNLEGLWQPIDHLSLDFTGDWQRSLYTSFASATAGGTGYTGFILQRQPRIQFRITPAYDVPMSWGSVRVFATYSYIGLRYSDIANQEVLPDYYTLDAGVVAQLGHSFEIRVQGTNLTNQVGLTEGNARVALGSGSGVSNDFEMARPIFGREVNLQVRYKF